VPVRSEVRDTQRSIAALDAGHARALRRLDQAVAHRAEMIADADRQVALARAEVDRAIADMARRVSVELTAHLLGLDISDVRRAAKANPDGSGAGSAR
jgi:hypothetical protein